MRVHSDVHIYMAVVNTCFLVAFKGSKIVLQYLKPIAPLNYCIVHLQDTYIIRMSSLAVKS